MALHINMNITVLYFNKPCVAVGRRRKNASDPLQAFTAG